MFDFNSIEIIIPLGSMLTKMLNKSFYLFWKNANFSGYYNIYNKYLHESRKPLPLSDYDRSLDKSYKAAKRARKDVTQFGQQSLQSVDPLVVHNDGTIVQKEGEISLEQLNMLIETTGLTKEDMITGRGRSPPRAHCVDQWKIYKYDRSLVSPDSFPSLQMQMQIFFVKQVVLRCV